MVIAKLRAPKGVRPHVRSIVMLVFAQVLICPLDDLVGGHVHTTDGGDDPNLVTDSDLPSFALKRLDRRNFALPLFGPLICFCLELISNDLVVVVGIVFTE